MDNIAKRLASYMDKHPLDLGDTDCERADRYCRRLCAEK